ncbi:MAG: hypothetical protein MJA31_16475, partial [Clostridia bacterium]|nr:hypothetical protein [Clostridia bacterium]
IEKKMSVYYKVSDTDECNDDEELEKEHKVGFDNEESEFEEPVITLDNIIPEVTDQETFLITGTYENVEKMHMHSAYNVDGKVEMKDNKFSYTAKLFTGKNGGTQFDKGIYNWIQIIAINGDKMLVREFVVYYKE